MCSTRLGDLAVQVLGAEAQAWVNKPHQLLGGQSPAAFALGGGSDKVRSMLNAIQNGGFV
ncbi:antitoxin Xre/MbcA/ParS toxin-binding domain-containing protein [Variovorax sp. LT1P1]|uniref:antitoxin Xre/MbcA/ParS toxin-binding domain-containing protein n=1 Tax=Variovorax sp. LT1P1 TaxID=3443730 RepID=UPI003F466908